MFDVLLIANRGEIACRVMRTAKRMGMRTVAVYSDADARAKHVREADLAVRIGPPPARQSYLSVDAILEAAATTKAQAIHPGYGFLSENAEFAEACERSGLVFVGPSSAAIRAMGSKIEAKRLVEKAGTPVVPGYQGDDQTDARLTAAAVEVGYPLLIKASAGGGGKGMRLVESADAFELALQSARREAEAAFGDARMLLERYLPAPKHLEVQILADGSGNTMHLFERDCSVQRRHQKVIEEAPGPTVDRGLRERLGEAAIQAARAVDYVGAGTVEFIADGDAFYFMEMNTRLQVEHPVTEAVAGVDLVEWQLKIAAGETLEIDLGEPAGHAIEVRVYAENPATGFLPSTGELVALQLPENIRVDAGVSQGDSVTVHYDPMIGKLIAHGESRTEARIRLIDAIDKTRIAGIEHNLGYLRNLLAHPAFVAGDYDTHLAEAVHDAVLPKVEPRHWALAALASLLMDSVDKGPGTADGWARADGWRLNLAPVTYVKLENAGDTRSVKLVDRHLHVDATTIVVGHYNLADDTLTAEFDGVIVDAGLARSADRLYLMMAGQTFTFDVVADAVRDHAGELGSSDRVTSPMPGQVVAVAVAVGDEVEAGAVLVTVEAMKMEHAITAPFAGVVKAVACVPGQRVDERIELVTLEPV